MQYAASAYRTTTKKALLKAASAFPLSYYFQQTKHVIVRDAYPLFLQVLILKSTVCNKGRWINAENQYYLESTVNVSEIFYININDTF